MLDELSGRAHRPDIQKFLWNLLQTVFYVSWQFGVSFSSVFLTVQVRATEPTRILVSSFAINLIN